MTMAAQPMERPRVVILGAGFGGLMAAKSLSRANVRVTLIDRQNYHLFQPLLYQVATATLSPADIAVPIRSILRDQANADVVLGSVVAVVPAGGLHQRDRPGERPPIAGQDALGHCSNVRGTHVSQASGWRMPDSPP